MIPLKSEITKKLLNYFFLNPEESLYVNELARQLSLDKRNLVKKIKELEKAGILKSQARGNLKLYSINKDYALYDEYRNIVLKTIGFEASLRSSLNNIKGIKEVYIFGSYATNRMDSSSDIDILAIGSHSVLELQRVIVKLQKDTGREFNVTNLSAKEFQVKKKDKDPFITHVFKTKTIRLI